MTLRDWIAQQSTYTVVHMHKIFWFFCPCSEKVNFPPKLFTWLMKMNIPLIFPISMRRAYSTRLTQRPSFTHLTGFLKSGGVATFVHVYKSVDLQDVWMFLLPAGTLGFSFADARLPEACKVVAMQQTEVTVNGQEVLRHSAPKTWMINATWN